LPVKNGITFLQSAFDTTEFMKRMSEGNIPWVTDEMLRAERKHARIVFETLCIIAFLKKLSSIPFSGDDLFTHMYVFMYLS